MSSTKKNITIRIKEYFTGMGMIISLFVGIFIGALFSFGSPVGFLCGFLFFVTFFWISSLFAEFDIQHKKFRTGLYFWGIKIGKWKKLEIENVNLIFLSKGGMNQTFNLHHGAISNSYKFSVYNLWFQDNEGETTKFVFTYRDKEVKKMIQLAEEISTAHNIEFENRLI